MLGWKKVVLVSLLLLLLVGSMPVASQGYVNDEAGYINYEVLEPEVGCPCWREWVRRTRIDLDSQIDSYYLRAWLRRAAAFSEIELATEVGGWQYRQFVAGAN